MSYLSRQPTQEVPLERRLSIEETYSLAELVRRKSSSHSSRRDLRHRLGHAFMLDAVEQVIRNSPPTSPRPSITETVKPDISFSTLESSAPVPPKEEQPSVDEYGFEYDDDEEDLGGLSLCRTASRQY